MSESDEQKEIIKYFRTKYPEYALCLRVSQSGGFRGAGRRGAIRTALITAMGGVTGESDIAILLPRGKFGSLLIEHKKHDNTAGPTDAQIDYIRHHNDCGNCATVTKGISMAKHAIDQYMSLV